eukprot:TRINITY_DN20314_c0_g1_i1.p1 TRINITY_DN20314_c0_g1~~TRINITY_DN20314_c0_g1_i1.p1  ORF type:complete len:548 (+),score=154.19 TRINITY_DN20314_c0_g1_i1:65-1708(+)
MGTARTVTVAAVVLLAAGLTFPVSVVDVAPISPFVEATTAAPLAGMAVPAPPTTPAPPRRSADPAAAADTNSTPVPSAMAAEWARPPPPSGCPPLMLSPWRVEDAKEAAAAGCKESGRRVFYAITFGGEVDLLYVHLHEIYPVVDVIVIVETALTHRKHPKPSVYRMHSELFSVFADKVRYYFFGKEEVDALVGLCVHRKRISCGWSKWELVRGMYRLISKGLSDADDGDIVVTNCDTDEVVHRHTLVRWKYCALPVLPGSPLNLTFANFWYNFNCMERPHRVMQSSAWVWKRELWTQMWQWYAAKDSAERALASTGKPVMRLGSIRRITGLSESDPRNNDTYAAVHLCRPDCKKRNSAACRRVEAWWERGGRNHAPLGGAHSPRCSQSQQAAWDGAGAKASEVLMATVVPNPDMDVSHMRVIRTFTGYDRGPDNTATWEEVSGALQPGGWHLSYFGGVDAMLRHRVRKAHAAESRESGDARKRAEQQVLHCRQPWKAKGRAFRSLPPLEPGRAAALLPHLIGANMEHYKCAGWFRDYSAANSRQVG